MLELLLLIRYLFLLQRDIGFSLFWPNLLAAALVVQSSFASNNTVHNTNEVPQLYIYTEVIILPVYCPLACEVATDFTTRMYVRELGAAPILCRPCL